MSLRSCVRLLGLCVCTVFLGSIQGCASFYLHDAATQKRTDSAKDALSAIKIDSIFDAESTYLDTLQQTETSVVTSKLSTQGDEDVLEILNGPGPGGLDGLTLLKGRISGYLLSLVGASDVGCNIKLWRAVDQDPSKLWASATDLKAFAATLESGAISQIKTQCPPPNALKLKPPSPTPSLQDAINVVTTDLSQIDTAQKAAQAAQTQMDAALKDVETQLSAGKPIAPQVANDLKTLQTYLTDANPVIRRYASSSLSGEIGTTIAALGQAGTSDTALTKEERSGIAVMQALFGVGDAFASPPRVPHPNALAAAQSWLQYVGSQAATELQGEQIQLQDHQAQLAAVLTEIYYLSKSGENAAEIQSKKPLTGTQGLADLIDSPDSAAARAIDGAVLYYAAAWTRGFAADAAAFRRGYIDQRKANVVSARAASAAWVGSLKPAVDTLAEYGSGGFDPQTIVQLLQALGVGAIAVGVNK